MSSSHFINPASTYVTHIVNETFSLFQSRLFFFNCTLVWELFFDFFSPSLKNFRNVLQCIAAYCRCYQNQPQRFFRRGICFLHLAPNDCWRRPTLLSGYFELRSQCPELVSDPSKTLTDLRRLLFLLADFWALFSCVWRHRLLSCACATVSRH